MTVFSHYQKDPEARRVVGLLANSKTTSGLPMRVSAKEVGMAIAALARITSQWKKDGKFSSCVCDLKALSAPSRICRPTILKYR